MEIRATHSLVLAILAAAGVIAGTSCSSAVPNIPGPTQAPGQTVPASSVKVEVVATNLQVPWALAFAPDSRLFFTERPGSLRVMVDGQVQAETVAKLPVTEIGEGGLLGLALDPAFQENGYLYVMYTYTDLVNGLRNRVSRLTESQGKAGDEKILVNNLPAGIIHDGGRVKFGPDGKLYFTLGDTSDGTLAQQLTSPAGKILRINPDGSIPDDNPFPGSPIYSYGNRNPQGLAWNPVTGELFSSEHGPVGNDEINIIRAGGNYGWPDISGTGGAPKYIDPILVYNPSVAPSGATFYTGDQLPQWRNNLFVATLIGQSMLRIVLQSPGYESVETNERLYNGQFGRLRDVIQGPDGFLYFSTNNLDGRGAPAANDDRILRIVPGGQ